MSEPELEPFDEQQIVDSGLTAQMQANLKARAAAQTQPPKALRLHELPPVAKRPDTGNRSPLQILRSWIVDRLTEDDPGLSRQDATIYADLWLEYTEAQESIDANGMVCLHPRTPIIIENPYMPHRAKTRVALGQIRNIRADWLWDHSNIERAREWHEAAKSERDQRLTANERHRLKQMEGKAT